VNALVLVTVGTDHHPFDRLVGWVDRWAQDHPDVQVVVQYGSAAPPVHAEGHQLLDRDQLQLLMSSADVVVTHGGPATITEARHHGRRPVCVPRNPQLGEHVDDHQQRFARFLDRNGMVELVDTEDALRAALDAALVDASAYRIAVTDDPETTRPGVRRVGELVAELVSRRRGAASADEQPLTVLFVGGQGRSGSTLVERAVGQLPDTVSVGEVVHLWRRGLRGDELCGCGQNFHSCEFWRAVGDAGFGGWDSLDPQAMVDLRYAVDRNRFVPYMVRPGLNRRYDRLRAEYVEALTKLYRAIARVSGASVIVDSSKHASYALLLREVPGIDLRLLHIVRDSPAVAHAWSKQVERPETDGVLMPTYGPVEAALLWNSQNVMLDWMGRRLPHAVLRYEDFVEAPKDALLRVLALLGREEDPSALHFLDGSDLQLTEAHTVAGNPMRFTTGQLTIRNDSSWRGSMPAGRRRLVGALTAPIRYKYRYIGRPS